MDDFWSIMKEIKYSSMSFDDECDITYTGFNKNWYEESKWSSEIENIEQHLKMNSSEDINDNITDSSLKTAAEMFLFLNSCPNDFKSWFLFYEDIFQNDPLEVIVLKLNRILKGKSNQQNERLKVIAKKLFKSIETLFAFKYQHIRNISQGLGNFSWKGGN